MSMPSGEPTGASERVPPPWKAGVEAARANALPGAVLSVFAVGLLLSYWYVPAVAAVLERLGQIKSDGGWLFVAVSTALFGGLIPGLVQRARPTMRHTMPWSHLGYIMLFWAVKGIEVDLLYRVQAMWFGQGADLATVVKKIAFDMGFYCPVWAVPSTVAAYAFKDAGFSWSRLRREEKVGSVAWYKRRVIPVAISNWAVWVPAVSVIYCLPLALQLPMQNLVLCFWSLLLVLQVKKLEAGGDL